MSFEIINIYTGYLSQNVTKPFYYHLKCQNIYLNFSDCKTFYIPIRYITQVFL